MNAEQVGRKTRRWRKTQIDEFSAMLTRDFMDGVLNDLDTQMGLDELSERTDRMLREREEHDADRRQQIFAAKVNFIDEDAFLCWRKDGITFHLCESSIYQDGLRMAEMFRNMPPMPGFEGLIAGTSSLYRFGRWNGYATFETMPFIAPGTKGIVGYVPVHGGITYFQDWSDGSCTYGFDTAHAISMQKKEIIDSIEWAMEECEAMGRNIRIVAGYEPDYLEAPDEKGKAGVLSKMYERLGEDFSENPGVLMNVLFGNL